MKILPFIARGTSYYLKVSYKACIFFSSIGLMLSW